MANIVLWEETGVKNATIAQLSVPMRTQKYLFDYFELLNTLILPFCFVVIFVLPIKKTIRLMILEKESNVQQHYSMLGINSNLFLIAWFCEFMSVCTIISIFSSLILRYGGILKYSNPFLLCIYFEIYCLSLFGYLMVLS